MATSLADTVDCVDCTTVEKIFSIIPSKLFSIMIVRIFDLRCVVVSYPTSAPGCRVVSEIKQNVTRIIYNIYNILYNIYNILYNIYNICNIYNILYIFRDGLSGLAPPHIWIKCRLFWSKLR